MARKKRKKSKPRKKILKKLIWGTTFIVSCLLTGAILYFDYSQYTHNRDAILGDVYAKLFPDRSSRRTTQYPAPATSRPSIQVVPTPPPSSSTEISISDLYPFRKLPKMSIIIDDMGYNTSIETQLIDLPWPLTFAVLPHVPHSAETAEQAYRRHRDILLHLPMEPEGYPSTNPGDDALLVSLSDNQNEERLRRAISAVPHIIGINNHMGSKFTRDNDHMTHLLEKITVYNLFFIDSRTTPKSVAYDLAQEMGIPSAKRNVFLDHRDDFQSICEEINTLVAEAVENGSAIGIGHPRSNTLHALEHMLPSLDRQSVRIVPVSELVR